MQYHLSFILKLKGTYSNKNNFNLGVEKDNYYWNDQRADAPEGNNIDISDVGDSLI